MMVSDELKGDYEAAARFREQFSREEADDS